MAPFLKYVAQNLEGVREFLLALRDCVRTSPRVPAYVVSGLTTLLDGDIEEKPSRGSGETAVCTTSDDEGP
jgi:hypothetical protein